nr:PREDICTED: uncharacterized protein LOC109032321 [Bemisia tabaci]
MFGSAQAFIRLAIVGFLVACFPKLALGVVHFEGMLYTKVNYTGSEGPFICSEEVNKCQNCAGLYKGWRNKAMSIKTNNTCIMAFSLPDCDNQSQIYMITKSIPDLGKVKWAKRIQSLGICL